MSDDQMPGRTEALSGREQSSLWDGGWYLFEDGQVIGPLNAKETFSRPKTAPSGRARMVSRKGFSQWYPIQDFAEIYSMAGRYADHLGQAGTTNPDIAAKPEPIAHNIGFKHKDTTAAEQKIGMAQRDVSSHDPHVMEGANFRARSGAANIARTENQASQKMTRKEKKRAADEERKNRKFAARQAKLARKAAEAQNVIPRDTFEQRYLAVSSRLRLGRISSPLVGAIIFFPITLGGYWWAWMTRASEEVSWHLNGASRMNFVLPMWMCLIPGVHLILAYMVARMTRNMEEQNGYHTVSPVIATIAAIFPPLYIMMIQTALNRHWRLHVYHSASR